MKHEVTGGSLSLDVLILTGNALHHSLTFFSPDTHAFSPHEQLEDLLYNKVNLNMQADLQMVGKSYCSNAGSHIMKTT